MPALNETCPVTGAQNPRVKSIQEEERSVACQISKLRREITGHSMKLIANPTSFDQLPWNNWVFERTYNTSVAGVARMKIGDIIDQIVVRVGIASPDTVRVRVKSACGWVTAMATDFNGPSMPDLNVEFYELAGQQIGGQKQYARKTVRAKGSLSQPAFNGFVYPVEGQNEIFGYPEKEMNVAKFQCPVTSATTMTVRINVLWQSGVDLTWFDIPTML